MSFSMSWIFSAKLDWAMTYAFYVVLILSIICVYVYEDLEDEEMDEVHAQLQQLAMRAHEITHEAKLLDDPIYGKHNYSVNIFFLGMVYHMVWYTRKYIKEHEIKYLHDKNNIK